MRKIHLYPHGGSGNHGCEAIVRTTLQLLEGNDVTLYSENPDQDRFYMKDIGLKVKKPTWQAKKTSAKYVRAFFANLAGNKKAYDELFFDPILSDCQSGDILLSIGGDNYCYGDNEYIYLVNNCLRKKGCKTVLWGCSIEPDRMSDKMKEDLSRYDMIIARESISYESLKQINGNVKLCPDPAFTLSKTKCSIPKGLNEKGYIGINASPMIQSNEKSGGITLDNYRHLIEHILTTSGEQIALIPHVVWEHNDDRKPLQILAEEFSSSGRVFLVEDQNCMALKSVISNCKCFIGARTHSTIAAYSSKVPTLVVGYSNKAKGIAKDLFGSVENYVLPVQELKNKRDLTNAYIWLTENQGRIREIYDFKMDAYIEKAFCLKNVLNEL